MPFSTYGVSMQRRAVAPNVRAASDDAVNAGRNCVVDLLLRADDIHRPVPRRQAERSIQGENAQGREPRWPLWHLNQAQFHERCQVILAWR